MRLKQLFCIHDFKVVSAKDITFTPVRYKDEWNGKGRYELGPRNITEVLYRCSKCAKLKTKTLDGHWAESI